MEFPFSYLSGGSSDKNAINDNVDLASLISGLKPHRSFNYSSAVLGRSYLMRAEEEMARWYFLTR